MFNRQMFYSRAPQNWGTGGTWPHVTSQPPRGHVFLATHLCQPNIYNSSFWCLFSYHNYLYVYNVVWSICAFLPLWKPVTDISALENKMINHWSDHLLKVHLKSGPDWRKFWHCCPNMWVWGMSSLGWCGRDCCYTSVCSALLQECIIF